MNLQSEMMTGRMNPATIQRKQMKSTAHQPNKERRPLILEDPDVKLTNATVHQQIMLSQPSTSHLTTFNTAQQTLEYSTLRSRCSEVPKTKSMSSKISCSITCNHTRTETVKSTSSNVFRDEATVLWQNLRLTPEMTMKDQLEKYRKEVAKDDF